MGFSLPPFAASLATRLFESSGTKVLTEADKAAKLASRLEALGAKGALSGAEKAEQAELKKAVGELKDAGWKPKEGAAPKDPNESSFAEGKKPKPSSVTGVIDGIQNWVDGATLAGGVAGAAMTAGVVTAPAGVVTTAVSDVAGLISAGVDVVQAGVAAAHGDYKDAGEQLLQAGGRAIGAIPYIGTAIRGAKLAKAGVQAAELGEKAIAAVATKAATSKGAALTEEAVKTFTKETADHPALTDLAYSLGSKFKGATLETIADAKGVSQIAETAEKIRKGETAGTTLSRYKKGEEGVNDFLHDVSAKFTKSPGTKLSGEAVATLAEDTGKLLGKAGAPLAESLGKALGCGKLATKDLEAVRKAAAVLDGTGNQVVRDGVTLAMKKALESSSPGKALADVAEKAAMIEKAAMREGAGTTSMTTKLSQGSQDAQAFRQTFETLLDSRISTKGLADVLGKPELLSGVGTKAGFDRLVSEARRMSI